MTEPNPTSTYPARLRIDYPEGPRSRGSVFLRLFLAIPVGVILGLVSGPDLDYDGGDTAQPLRTFIFEVAEEDAAEHGEGFFYEYGIDTDEADGDDDDDSAWRAGAAAGGVLFVPTLLALLFVKRYPRWWFDWHLALARFETRVVGYVLLLRDEYPALDEEQAVHLDLDYPDAAELGRGMPLIKWLLVIPHLICLAVLGIAILVCTIIAWFAILFTGQHPRGLHSFIVGFLRWGLRVKAYALLLITDEYPPFSLD